MTQKEELKAKLIIFLEDNGVFEKFAAYLYYFPDIDSLCESAIRNKEEGVVISNAFSWSSTEEGHDYWFRLNELFYSSYENLPTDRIPSDPQWSNMWEE